MQANGGCGGGTISPADATASQTINSNLDQVTDISLSASSVQQQQQQQIQHHHSQAQSVSQVSSKAILVNQSQTQTQQQQPKAALSPSQQSSVNISTNSAIETGTSSNNLVNHQHQMEQASQLQNAGSTYHRNQRYGHYVNQHHPPQYHQHNHHHHRQNNKYNNSKSDNESIVNHVILITVINPHYPITCDLIHQICSSYGKVNRIVIFKKNGVQALVEFDNVESAKRAKSSLQNCDIYSGCCTLRVEIAKPVRLNVHKNDSESFDYTNPNLESGCIQSSTEAGPEHNQHSNQHEQASSATQSSAYVHSGGPHHARGPGSNRRMVSDISTSSGNVAVNNTIGNHQHANQFLHQAQHVQSDNQNMKQSVSSTPSSHQNSQQATAYVMGQPIEHSTANSSESVGTFHHQDEDFNVPRGGMGNSSSHQSNFLAVDPFMTTVPGGPHGMPGNMYSRQDGGHHNPQHHHHHHHRVGLAGSGSGSGSGHIHHNSGYPPNTTNSLMGGPSNLMSRGTVMMVYGLSAERINCDRLFNLFCLYGNVVRVKFLRSKEGCAMVQMGDVIAVDRCVSSLNKISLFGNELQISYSKQAFLHDVIQPFSLPDGSPSFKDFMGNKNNRFKNLEVASKNRILPPSRVLHFFNAPSGMIEDELVHLFKQATDHEPVSVKIFTPKAENAKSFSGLVTFGDPAEATEALVLCNHISMPKAGAPHPYILRLCFSPPTYC